MVSTVDISNCAFRRDLEELVITSLYVQQYCFRADVDSILNDSVATRDALLYGYCRIVFVCAPLFEMSSELLNRLG